MFLTFSRRKEIAALLILGCFLSGNAFAQAVAPAQAGEKSGQVAASDTVIKAEKPKRKLPSGLLELTGFKSQIFLYAPEGLEAEKKFPLLVMAPNDSYSAEKQLEYIVPVAKSLECFVLVLNAWPKEGVPYEFDRWLLKVKNDIVMRFPIDPSKIYAIGLKSGGHYAAYLISAYPEDFSGAALIGEAWEGVYAPVIQPRTAAGQQMPVVAAFTADQQETKTKNEKWVLEYQQKGYPVQIMTPAEGQNFDSSEFKVAILEWLDQKGQAWKVVREEQNKTFKQRLKKGVKEFFEV